MALIEHLCNFSKGLISPKLTGRFDMQFYESSCKTLKNMLLMVEGGVTRRPSTTYLGSSYNNDYYSRLIPFKYSNTNYCVLEFSQNVIRVWIDTEEGTKVIASLTVKVNDEEPETSPFIPIVYKADALNSLKFCQSGNTIFFTHPNHYPRRLVCNNVDTFDDWDIEAIKFEIPAMQDINVTSASMKIDGTTLTVDNSGVIEPDKPFNFSASDVNNSFLITQQRSDCVVTEAGEHLVSGTYNLLTQGKWKGSVKIQRQPRGSAEWLTVKEFKSDETDPANFNYNGDEKFKDTLYRVVSTQEALEEGDTFSWTFTIDDDYIDVLCIVEAFIDENNVTIGMPNNQSQNSNTTVLWKQGAWTGELGYPVTVTIFEERLYYGRGMKLWASQTNNWYNFDIGELDTAGLDFTVPSADGIEWLLANNVLLIGTESAELTMGNEDNAPVTADAVPKIKFQSRNGSNNIDAVAFGDTVLYCQSFGKKINELAFSWESQKFNSPELTLLSPEITGNGITEMYFTQRPQPILWCVRLDGTLIGLTYNREQKIIAWHEHSMGGGGLVESITSVPFMFENQDCLWLVVNRPEVIDGATVNKRYVEKFTPIKNVTKLSRTYNLDCCSSKIEDDTFKIATIHLQDEDTSTQTMVVTCSDKIDFTTGMNVRLNITKQEDSDLTLNNVIVGLQESGGIEIIDEYSFKGICSYNDRDKKYNTITPINNCECVHVEKRFIGLNHLNGYEVQALIDGSPSEMHTITDGTVELSRYGRDIIIGLPYKSRIEPMPFVVQTSAGASQPYPIKINKAIIKFFETTGAYIEIEGKRENIQWRTTEDKIGEPVFDYLKDKEVLLGAIPERSVTISICQDAPLPMTVLNVLPYFTIVQE